jgi:hypothetical protein
MPVIPSYDGKLNIEKSQSKLAWTERPFLQKRKKKKKEKKNQSKKDWRCDPSDRACTSQV